MTPRYRRSMSRSRGSRRQIPHFQVQALHRALTEFPEPHAGPGSQLRNRPGASIWTSGARDGIDISDGIRNSVVVRHLQVVILWASCMIVSRRRAAAWSLTHGGMAEARGDGRKDLPAVSERLGHSSVYGTATVYSIELRGEMKRQLENRKNSRRRTLADHGQSACERIARKCMRNYGNRMG